MDEHDACFCEDLYILISTSDGLSPIRHRNSRKRRILPICKCAKNRGAQGTPTLNLLQNPQGWFLIRLENRRILECPTVAQSETYKALSLLTDYRLSPIGVEDSLSVYLRLCLLSMYTLNPFSFIHAILPSPQ